MEVRDALNRMLSAIIGLSPQEGILWAGYALFLVLLVWLLYVHVRTSYRRQWYGPPLGLKKVPSWHDVRYLMKVDPLDFGEKGGALSSFWKPCHWSLWMLRDVLLVPVLALAVWKIGEWISFRGAIVSVEKMASMATVIGAASVFVAVFGIFYQGRVKSRSENRQKWINDLREEMNVVIAGIPHWSVHKSVQCLESNQDTLEMRHAKIELYLNPSERVHRAFMALVRYMYGMPALKVDEEVFNQLWPDACIRPNMQDQTDWDEVKSDVIRLANVLLKREWEQVKLIA